MNGLPLGVYGGSFDPPHRMHVQMAQAAIAQLGLEWLWVLPTPHPGHRQQPRTPFAHRLAMARLAFSPLGDRVRVSDLEAQRQGPTYTVDTLSELKRAHPESPLWLLMGADQAASFHTWHHWEQILELAQLVVMPRAGATTFSSPVMQWHNDRQRHWVTLSLEPQGFSATQLRQALPQAIQAPPGLDDPVWAYIQQHHLYQDPHE